MIFATFLGNLWIFTAPSAMRVLLLFESLDTIEICKVPDIGSAILDILSYEYAAETRQTLLTGRHVDILEILTCFLAPYDMGVGKGASYSDLSSCLVSLRILSSILEKCSLSSIDRVISHKSEPVVLVSNIIKGTMNDRKQTQTVKSIRDVSIKLLRTLLSSGRVEFRKSQKSTSKLFQTACSIFLWLVNSDYLQEQEELANTILILESFGERFVLAKTLSWFRGYIFLSESFTKLLNRTSGLEDFGTNQEFSNPRSCDLNIIPASLTASVMSLFSPGTRLHMESDANTLATLFRVYMGIKEKV